MTTLEINDQATGNIRRRGPLAWLRAKLRQMHLDARRRRAMLELSELDAHLLRDIGISWTDVQDGLHGRRRLIWLEPLPRETDHSNP